MRLTKESLRQLLACQERPDMTLLRLCILVARHLDDRERSITK